MLWNVQALYSVFMTLSPPHVTPVKTGAQGNRQDLATGSPDTRYALHGTLVPRLS